MLSQKWLSTGVRCHPSYSSSDSDFILISNDGVVFRVHSQVLSLSASDAFRKMRSSVSFDAEKHSIEPVLINERADIVAALLDTLYPDRGLEDERPNLAAVLIATPDQLMSAATKLDIPCAVQAVRRYLFKELYPSPAFERHIPPIRKYGIACRLGWSEAAKAASTETLNLDLNSLESKRELETIAAKDVLRLQGLHHDRKELLFELISHPGALNVFMLWCSCRTVHTSIESDPRWKAFLLRVLRLLGSCPSYAIRLKSDAFWDEPDCAGIFNIHFRSAFDMFGMFGSVCSCTCGYRPSVLMPKSVCLERGMYMAFVGQVLDSLPKTI